jgi:hypothetical protein
VVPVDLGRQYFAGMVAQFASVETVGGQVTNLKVSLDTYTSTFTTIAWIAIAAGASCSCSPGRSRNGCTGSNDHRAGHCRASLALLRMRGA